MEVKHTSEGNAIHRAGHWNTALAVGPPGVVLDRSVQAAVRKLHDVRLEHESVQRICESVPRGNLYWIRQVSHKYSRSAAGI